MSLPMPSMIIPPVVGGSGSSTKRTKVDTSRWRGNEVRKSSDDDFQVTIPSFDQPDGFTGGGGDFGGGGASGSW